MGQQQLLLLVLSAVIVGISIVVGINMFGEGAVQANEDAVMQDMMTIAGKGQEWFRKPEVMGGGGRSFSAVTLGALNIDGTNSNGTYQITAAGDSAFTIQGDGVEGMTVTVDVFADSVAPPTITRP